MNHGLRDVKKCSLSGDGRRHLFVAALVLVLAVGTGRELAGQSLLVPMDGSQSDHLRAYGLVYETIDAGEPAEWLLNFRAGSFLLPALRRVEERAALLGVSVERLTGSELASK